MKFLKDETTGVRWRNPECGVRLALVARLSKWGLYQKTTTDTEVIRSFSLAGGMYVAFTITKFPGRNTYALILSVKRKEGA